MIIVTIHRIYIYQIIYIVHLKYAQLFSVNYTAEKMGEISVN